jgi:hypothetical protein
MRALIGLTVLALGAGAGCYAAMAAANDTIVIRQRFTESSCEGKCIDWDLTVKAGGTVDLRTGSAVATVAKRKFNYTVTAEEYAAFEQALAGIKPNGDPGVAGTCNKKTKLLDWEIRWQTATPARLRACGDEAAKAREAVEAGLKALRINPVTGARE